MFLNVEVVKERQDREKAQAIETGAVAQEEVRHLRGMSDGSRMCCGLEQQMAVNPADACKTQ